MTHFCRQNRPAGPPAGALLMLALAVAAGLAGCDVVAAPLDVTADAID